MNSAAPTPNSGLSSQEVVFSNDLIREMIFAKCDRQSLLNSRLVSHRWADYVSKFLQKTQVIGFTKRYSHHMGPRLFRFNANENRHLTELVNLVKNSTNFSEFPCTSFDFRLTDWEQSKMYSAQPFFNTYGAFIKKIAFHEWLCLEDLKHLLLVQTRNLEEEDLDDPNFSIRLTNIMTIIVNASSATCRKLLWSHEIPNFKIPQMFQVEHLTIQYNSGGEETNSAVCSLGDGVMSLGKTFPNLKYLQVRIGEEMGMVEFLPTKHIFSDKDPAPAANLKTVTLIFHEGQVLRHGFQEIFPNASIRVCNKL